MDDESRQDGLRAENIWYSIEERILEAGKYSVGQN